jgi:ATP-dependent DNA helicase RecQ
VITRRNLWVSIVSFGALGWIVNLGVLRMTAQAFPPIPDDFFHMLREVWGFDALREPQREAIASILTGRDTLVVMPTGGGKSLCYQAPAQYRGGLTIVVSPLIALMKDQVDSLEEFGIAAARLDSSLRLEEKRQIANRIARRELRLLFASPERLLDPEFPRLVEGNEVHTIAIDEAHCVSQWGHDFRPEYRQLAKLREAFPQAAVHAFTATATVKVRRDIVEQLQLRSPNVLVSSFDRPNLTYRVLPQLDIVEQVREVLDRYRGQGGIIYCMRRADVESLCQVLGVHGYSVVAYHAGLSAEERKRAQDAFINESIDVVVATVAFGMGIDRSNVRFVIHTSMPKTIEHYQQETGRAGRDGLPSECVLLFSLGDMVGLRRITANSLREAGASEELMAAQRAQMEEMSRYCRTPVCRHRALAEYFGESYDRDTCEACDLCLGDTDNIADAKIIAQKILSCVHRVGERFGVNYLVDVLTGSVSADVERRGHQSLSTYGILREIPKTQLKDWIYQLVGQGAITLEGDDYPILKLNAQSREILFGDREPRLLRSAAPKEKKPSKSRPADGVFPYDKVLFERLRVLRRDLAQQKNVPPYVVFSDRVLAELSARRPSDRDHLLLVSGIGEAKAKTYGQAFLDAIDQHCRQTNLAMNQALDASSPSSVNRPTPHRPGGAKSVTVPLLRQGLPLESIATQAELSIGTVVSHLVSLIESGEIESIDPWVPQEMQQRIVEAANRVGREKLKPIFDALEQAVPYDWLRMALAIEGAQARTT